MSKPSVSEILARIGKAPAGLRKKLQDAADAAQADPSIAPGHRNADYARRTFLAAALSDAGFDLGDTEAPNVRQGPPRNPTPKAG